MSTDNDARPGPLRVFAVTVVVAVAVACFTALGGPGFATSSASAQEYQYGKATVCHRTGNDESQEIGVSVDAVPAQLAHGDTLGVCTG